MKPDIVTSTKCLAVALCCLASTAKAEEEEEAPHILINEVQVANNDQFIDPSYNYGGWIELYNPTDTVIWLRTMYVTDGVNTYRLLSSHGKIAAGGFVNLWFDHNSKNGNYGGKATLQVPFKLDADGGTIALLDLNKEIITSVDYPASVARCSYARTQDGGEEWGTTSYPTPGATNNNTAFASIRIAAPVVDTDSRLFDEPFKVKVRIPRGAQLRYTTDGSAPTAEHGETSQTGSFDISKTTILRCCLVANGYLTSPVVTRSYIYRNHDYYLPVISIATHPDNFYDNTIGLYVQGTNGVSGNGQNSPCNWNRDWERPVNMEYLVPHKEGKTTIYEAEVNQEFDLEICGGWTRAYGGGTVDGRYWPMRASFRLKGDKRYEHVKEIAYPVFPDKPYQKYNVWQVRNGGNDTSARIKDPAIQQIVLKSGFYVDCQDYQPAHVFFNGEYFGMLNIRESNNRHYGYSNYGIDTDDMDQFDLSDNQYKQKVGDNKAWTALVNQSAKLKANPTEENYRLVCEKLDIDEYINYMALECWLGPSDWITNTNNVKGFCSRSDDGKFHFVLFDTDSAFGNANMLNSLMSNDYNANVDNLFRNLMGCDSIRHQFIDAFCLVDGSVFEPTRCKEIVETIYNNINPALNFEGKSSNTNVATKVQEIYNGNRISNLRNYYKLGAGNYVRLSSNIDEARLMVNGQQVPTGKFAGYLFSYKGKPITLTAKAPAGYAFKGWYEADGNAQYDEGSSPVSEEESFDLSKAYSVGTKVALVAAYKPVALKADVPLIRINEVSAGNDMYINDYGKKSDWVELYNMTDVDIQLRGMYLSDNPDKPRKYQFTEGMVPAHGTCIVWCDGKDSSTQLHASFKLENADGAIVSIMAEDGSWSDKVAYMAQPRWFSYGRFPDGGCHLALLAQPTIDKPNKLGTFDFTSVTPEEWERDAIRSVPADGEMADASGHGALARTLYYNMSGQQIDRPVKGLYIRKDIYTDGTAISRVVSKE